MRINDQYSHDSSQLPPSGMSHPGGRISDGGDRGVGAGRTGARRSNRGRGRAWPAMGVAVALLVPAVFPAAAVASSARAAAVQEYPAGSAYERLLTTYGDAAVVAKRIVISAETTQVQLDPGLRTRGPEVVCSNDIGSPVVLAGLFATSDEWQANPTPVVAVEPGAVVAGSGAVFRYTCGSGEEESDRVVWEFVEGPAAGETVNLGHDEAYLVDTTRTLDYRGGEGEPREVAPGDQLVVTGTAGTWPTAANTTTSVVFYPASGEAPDESGDDIVLAPDGSQLSFTVPLDLDTRYLNGTAEIVTLASSVAPGASDSTFTTRTYWATYVSVAGPAKATSTISATLDRTYTLSVLRPRLTVTVNAQALPNETGFIAVNVDGTDVDVREVPGAERTRITFVLPPLPKGVHTITARYSGTTNVDGSESGTLRLRVLI